MNRVRRILDLAVRWPTSAWLVTLALLLALSVLTPAASEQGNWAATTAVIMISLLGWLFFWKSRNSKMRQTHSGQLLGRKLTIALRAFSWSAAILSTIFIALPYPIQLATSILLKPPSIIKRHMTFESGQCRADTKYHIAALTQPVESNEFSGINHYVRLLSECTTIEVTPQTNLTTQPKFYLSFLQFCENGALIKTDCSEIHRDAQVSDQMEALKRAIDPAQSNLVVFYVHGWRHNDRGLSRDQRLAHGERIDSDMRRLATLASYSAAFTNRDRQPGRTERRVVAVYVGWQGSQLELDSDSIRDRLLAALTFPSRKRASERASAHVVSAIKQIEEHLARLDSNRGLDRSNPDRNRMLVVGHSAGGNLLMHGLIEAMAKLIEARAGRLGEKRPLPPMRGPLGDLVVLINPASPASHWVNVQQSFYNRLRSAGVSADPCSDCELRFSNEQPPTVISITSGARGLTPEERQLRLARPTLLNVIVGSLPVVLQDRLLVVHDWITELVFPLSQMAFEGRWFDPAGRTAIGHFRGGTVGVPGVPPLGVSHSLEINGKADSPTRFENAWEMAQRQCAPDPHWLWFARVASPAWRLSERTADHVARFFAERQRLVGNVVPRMGWDGNDIHPNTKSFGVIQRSPNFMNAQFIHSPDRGDARSPVPPGFPYWNVSALDSVVEDHGRFVGYALWCTIHQLVLDDPAARPEPGRIRCLRWFDDPVEKTRNRMRSACLAAPPSPQPGTE